MFVRHHTLHDFGKTKQDRLTKAHVCIIGCGGLGHAAAITLATSGVGKLTLYDGDNVDLTNLHRQTTYTLSDIGKNKAFCLSEHILERCTTIIIHIHQKMFEGEEELGDIDVIVDCSDNAKTRLLCNRLAVQKKIPLVFGSAIGWDGQILVVHSTLNKLSSCLECVFPQMHTVTDRCENRGVFGPVPNIIGIMQAMECIKLICMEYYQSGKLMLYSGFTNELQTITFEKDENCKACGKCTCEAKQPDDKTYEISYEEYLEYNKKGKTCLLDIRLSRSEDEEIMGAIYMVESDVQRFVEKQTQFPKFILCEWGERSLEIAKKIGRENVKSIKGGARSVFK